jgi:hypothetical protein
VVDKNLSKTCSLILCDRIAEIELWEQHYSIYDEYDVIVITGDTKVTEDKVLLEDALVSNKPTIII